MSEDDLYEEHDEYNPYKVEISNEEEFWKFAERLNYDQNKLLDIYSPLETFWNSVFQLKSLIGDYKDALEGFEEGTEQREDVKRIIGYVGEALEKAMRCALIARELHERVHDLNNKYIIDDEPVPEKEQNSLLAVVSVNRYLIDALTAEIKWLYKPDQIARRDIGETPVHILEKNAPDLLKEVLDVIAEYDPQKAKIALRELNSEYS